MALQRHEWQVVDGPNQWRLAVCFWESVPGDPDVVNFRVINPDKPNDVNILQMEIYVMGRGPSQGMDLFFSGPAELTLGIREEGKFHESKWDTVKYLKRAKVVGYAIDNRHGRAIFHTDLG